MDENTKVANNQGEGTPQVDSTPPETTETATPSVESGEKEAPVEQQSDRLDKNPRFKEVIEQKNAAKEEAERLKAEAEQWKQQYYEGLQPQEQPANQPSDPYAGMSPAEKEQTKNFIDKFVMPNVEAKYAPFVQEYQTEKLNKQITEAKEFAQGYGIEFDKELPNIVNYLSRPENRGRLTATEAVRNLYFDKITNTVRAKTASELQKEKEVLMEKKKQANMTSSSINPQAVVQSEEAAKANMNDFQKTAYDVKRAIKAVQGGYKNPKVRS